MVAPFSLVIRRPGRVARWAAAALAGVALSSTAGATVEVDVTTCKAFLRTGEIGIVRNDLTCEFDRIHLDFNARLDLAGHTITKVEAIPGSASWDQQSPIYCGRKCTVFSSTEAPGRIVGPFGSLYDKVVGIEGGDYYDDTYCRSMRLENLVIEGFDIAVYARDARMNLFDIELGANDWGIAGNRVKITGLVSDGGGTCASGRIVKIRGATCRGASLYGLAGGKIRARNLVLEDSALGITAVRASLRDSVLTGSGVDISSDVFPRLRDTVCETSLQRDADGSPSWGVCLND